MNEYLLWLVLGIVIGWLLDWLFYARGKDGQINKLQASNAKLSSDLSGLQGQVSAGQTEADSLRIELANTASANSDLVGQLAAATRTSGEFEAQVGALSGNLDTSAARIAELEAALAACQANAEASAAAAAEADAQVEASASQVADLEAQLAAAQSSLEACESNVAELQKSTSQLEELRTQFAHAAAESGEPDDLQRIEGIGPKISSILINAGVLTFRALASKTPESIKEILKAAGMSRINDPSTWPEQAELAATGQWKTLETLQDELIGGRRVN